jgi:uncharacterized protein YrrD
MRLNKRTRKIQEDGQKVKIEKKGLCVSAKAIAEEKKAQAAEIQSPAA